MCVIGLRLGMAYVWQNPFPVISSFSSSEFVLVALKS